jgi:hypothetical protein
MLRRLRVLLHRKGRLSSSLIDNALGMPSVSAFVLHFGMLRVAFDRIGYITKRDCDWIDTQASWTEVTRKHAAYVAEVLASNQAGPSDIMAVDHTVKVRGNPKITFLVARQAKKLKPGHATTAASVLPYRPDGCGRLSLLTGAPLAQSRGLSIPTCYGGTSVAPITIHCLPLLFRQLCPRGIT